MRYLVIEPHGDEYQLRYEYAEGGEGIYKTLKGAQRRARDLTPKSKKLRWTQGLDGKWKARVD